MKFFLPVIAALVFSVSTYAQDFTGLDQVARTEMKEKNVVGAAIAVIKDGKVVYSKGFGVANSETNAPVTAQTLFQTGSIAKTFTAALILKLASEGKLRLDAPIGGYVTGLQSPRLARVTLAQLLSHTAGIIDEPDEFGAADETLMATYVRSWKDDYAMFEPGEVFSYSNSGYALAGLTAQEAVRKSYLELMQENIFAPLGMKTTTFRPTVAMTYPLAVGHRVKAGEQPRVVRPLAQDARLYPAGTMYSSLEEMTRFALMISNEGTSDGQVIVPPHVIEQMLTPHAVQLSAPDDTAYGYGMFMKTDHGVRQFWHDGSMTGYVAQMKLIPARKAAVIILGNTDNVVLSKTQEKALELILNLKPSTDQPGKAAARPPLPLTTGEMSQYVGTYAQPNRWQIEIFVRDGQLFIRELGQELPLTKIAENRFAMQFPNAARPVGIYLKPAAAQSRGFIHQYVWAFAKTQ